jgi:hypothetical protein
VYTRSLVGTKKVMMKILSTCFVGMPLIVDACNHFACVHVYMHAHVDIKSVTSQDHDVLSTCADDE